MTVCDKCGLDAERQVDSYLKREPVPGAMRIAIVTGVPTEDDFYANKPLSGRLGGVLCELLSQNGLEPDSCYLVPVTCHVAPENGTVTVANIDQSREALFEDLKWFRPDRILSVGAHSLQALTAEPGKSLKVTDAQGKWTTVHVGNRIVPVMPIQSPGTLLLKYRSFPDYARCIERFAGTPSNFEKPQSTLITTLDDARDAIEVICRKKFQPAYGGIQLRTYDIETAGFDPKTRELICKGVTCDPNTHFVFTEEVMDTPDIGKLWRRVLDFPEIKWGNWNGTNFDAPFLAHKYDFEFPSDFDGLLLHYALDERTSTHGLKVRGQVDFGAEEYEAVVEKYLDKTWGYRFAPRDILYDYQACDTALTWLELDYMLPKMDEGKLWSLYSNHLVPYARMYGELKPFGVRYDRPYLQKLNEKWSVEIETLKLELQMVAKDFNWVGKMIGKKNPVEALFNPGSPQQLCKLLYDLMGLPILDKKTLKELISGDEDEEYDWTDGSTDKKVIDVIVEKLAKEGKRFEQREEKLNFIHLLRQFRRLKTLNGTFVEGILEKLDENDKVYPNALVFGSVTGRPSYQSPSMQNLPKRDPEGLEKRGLPSYGTQIRHAVIPTPGYKIWDMDYCVAPETRILCSDLIWRTAGELEEGQDLIAFNEATMPGHRTKKLCRSTVLKNKTIVRPCYRVTTTRGTVVCSQEHMWLATITPKSCKHDWVKTEDLQIGTKISYYTEPWDKPKDDHDSGWLAGALDGDGWLTDANINFGQLPGCVLDRFTSLLDKHNINYKVDDQSPASRKKYPHQAIVKKVRVLGAGHTLKILGMCRPVRFMPRHHEVWEGRSPFGKLTKPAIVTGIEFLGSREVCAIETTTKTYIAEGMLSHNCQLEIRVAAWLSKDKRAIAMLQSDVDYHILTAANMFGIDPKEVSKEQRDMGKTQNFAIIYGQSDYAMSRSLGKTLEETAEFRRMYEAQFPDLVGYVKMCNEQVKTQGYVETEFGNRRRFPFIPDFKTLKAFQREAGNSPIQGTAVYICCSAAVKLHKMFDPAETRVLFTVHDQIVGESRADVAEEHFKVVMDVMQNPDLEDRGVPWKAEGEIKDRWANALKGAE